MSAQSTFQPEIHDEIDLFESWFKSLGAPFASQLMHASGRFKTEPTTLAAARSKRQLEFAHGRMCAQKLLTQFGSHESVLSNQDRSPLWPNGFVGSITHSNHWTWAAVGRKSRLKSIGIDTEPVVSKATREQVVFEIANVDEWNVCENLNLSETQIFTLVFSAKEALYKCCYPLIKQYFGFEHVAIESADSECVVIRTHESHPCFGQMPSSLKLHYLATANDVFTIAWLEK